MTDPFDQTDPNTAEELDEDSIAADPLEEGMDPPEHWQQANSFGTTATEQREGEDLAHRLAEERPDVQPDPNADRPAVPVEDLPDAQLDDSVDERALRDR